MEKISNNNQINNTVQTKDIYRDKYRGCLLGGAVGDALGYAVEFMSAQEIFARYGKNGIRKYKLIDGEARISDDTQMTLFTANALLLHTTKAKVSGQLGLPVIEFIDECYKDWYKTQTHPYPYRGEKISWLMNVPNFFSRRAPGGTCLSGISDERRGTIYESINNSKGCGGVMRVAPIGLYYKNKTSLTQTDMLGAEAAALTHGHELGYIPAAALVHLVYLLSHEENISVLDAVEDMKLWIGKLFEKCKYVSYFIELIDKAMELAVKDIDDIEAISKLGEGWVAEETLAIAVYCALKYENDFEKAIVAAVNHDGDSDSTGSVTGNILGAKLGMSRISQKFKDNLEIRAVIVEMADDLYDGCRIEKSVMAPHQPCRQDDSEELYSDYNKKWEQKYVTCDYRP